MDKKKLNIQSIKNKTMKINNQIKKRLVLLLLVMAGTMGAMAQTNPDPTQTVCIGNEPYVVTDTPGSTYFWSIVGGAAADYQINGTTHSITVDWKKAGTYTLQMYERSALNCDGPINSVIVTVLPKPTVNPIANVPYCDNEPTAAIAFTGAEPGTLYSWTNDHPEIGLAASGTGDISSFTATNSTAVPIVATITVTPSIAGGGTTCPGMPVSFKITVNPSITVDPVTVVPYCNGVTTAGITFTSPVAGATFAWTNDQPGIGLAASGNGNLPSFTAVNAGTVPVVAIITVTPSANGCVGTPSTFKITVNPVPTVDIVADVKYCDAEVSTVQAFTGPVTGTTYTWTNDQPGIGLAASGTGDVPVFTAVNTGTTPIIATIKVTPSANGCAGTPLTYKITVNPLPVPTIAGGTPVCAEKTGNVYTTEAGMSNYTWIVSAGGAITAGGTPTDNTVTITWNTAGNQTISVNYDNLNGCQASAPTVKTVRVDPIPATLTIFHR